MTKLNRKVVIDDIMFIEDWVRVRNFWYNNKTHKSVYTDHICKLFGGIKEDDEKLRLPLNWSAVWDGENSITYFWNKKTGETSYVKPCFKVKEQQRDQKKDNVVLPLNWERELCAEENKYFYFNREKNISKWSYPDE